MSKSRMSRREFLRLTTIASAAAALAACAPAVTATVAPQATQAPMATSVPAATSAPAATAVAATKPPAATAAPAASTYSEAPMLAALVKAGSLPSVDKRLPEKPMVVKGNSVGKYGGNWRMGTTGVSDGALHTRTFAYEQLVRWNPEWTAVIPNIAESFEVSKDATEFTFHLRKGLKWSDGKPFTAGDVTFFFDEILKDPDLKFAQIGIMKIAGKEGVCTKTDDFTLKFTFPVPYGLFMALLATPDYQMITNIQAEWAKTYMKKFVDPAKLAADMSAAKFTNYLDYFQAMVWRQVGTGTLTEYTIAGRPTMFPFVVDKPFTGSATQEVFVRNPYFYKVDEKGQQYPYIDKLTLDIYGDVAAMLLKASNGEIDFQMRHFNTNTNKPVLFDNQKKGDYTFFNLKDAANNKEVIHWNMSSKDPAKRAIFGNKDFRIGMSYAINRQEIIDTVFVGQAKPYQAAPLEGTPFYNKQLATQYIEFDVAKANAALDKALPKKDAAGMRTYPDGKPLNLIIETSNATKTDGDTANMLVKYWKAVGVSVEHKPEERNLLYTHKDGNDLDAMIWAGEGGANPIMDARCYLPWSLEAAWGVAWAWWYTGGSSEFKEAPTGDVKKVCDLYDTLKGTPTYEGQVEVMKQILQVAADAFFCIGVCTPPDLYGIRKNNFMNVTDNMLNSWVFPTAAPYNAFTYYFNS
jgi:peptide/nickel transport system substrate-binding protein